MEEESKRWMEHAGNDLKTARYLFRGRKYKEASFFCQQAAEKALKALFLRKRKHLLRVHDLVRLARGLDMGEDFVKDCERLSIVYVDARYPDVGTKKYTRDETAGDIKIAEGILRWARKNLS